MGKEEATRSSNKSKSTKLQKTKNGFKMLDKHKLAPEIWAKLTPAEKEAHHKQVKELVKDSFKTNKSNSKDSESKEYGKTVSFSEEKKDKFDIFSDKTESDSKKRLVKVMQWTDRRAKLTREPNNPVVVSASDTLKKTISCNSY